MSISCMAHYAIICLRLNITEGKDMGCCGSCGGEAPNHINDQDQEKDKEIEIKLSSDQTTDKEVEIEEK